MTLESQICRACLEPKTMELFSRSKRFKTGRSTRCKMCDVLYTTVNKAKVLASKQKYRETHRQTIKQAAREEYKTGRRDAALKRFAETNPEKVKASKTKWKAANGHLVALYGKRRHGQAKLATPPWVQDELASLVMSEMYALARLRTKVTGITWHVDHIVPLTSEVVCGLHCPANLRVIPAAINLAKCNKFLEELL